MAGGGGIGPSNGKKYPGKLTQKVLVTCSVAAMGVLIFGYDIGISGGVTSMAPFLRTFFPEVHRKQAHDTGTNQYCKFNSQKLTMFTSSLYLAALLSSIGASAVTRSLGRKLSMMIGGILFLIGAAINGCAYNVAMLIVGRIFLGLGIGFANQIKMVVDQFAELISRQTMMKVQVRLFTFLLWAALCISDYTVVQASPVADASDGSNHSKNEDTRGLLAVFVLAVSLVVGVSFSYWFCGYAQSNITRRVLRTFEVVNYPVDENTGFGAPRCTVCLVPFTEGGRVTVLPICRHIYHRACLRRWMASDVLSCPDCRQQYRPVAVWRLRDCFP